MITVHRLGRYRRELLRLPLSDRMQARPAATTLCSKLLQARFDFFLGASGVFRPDPRRQFSPPLDISFQPLHMGDGHDVGWPPDRSPRRPHRRQSFASLELSRGHHFVRQARVVPGLGVRACTMVRLIDHWPLPLGDAAYTDLVLREMLSLCEMAGFEPDWGRTLE